MLVRVLYRGEEKTFDMKEGETIYDLMKKMGLHPDVTIAMVDGKPVPEDVRVSDGMVVEMITVVSGG